MALSANKQREKEMLAIVRNESKKRKWQFRGWQSFKLDGPFLLSVSFYAYGKENKLNAKLQFKFKDIDNLNCQVTGARDYFINGPLFYKVDSNGMVFPDNYYQCEITEVTEEKITNLINEIDKQAFELVQNLSDKEKYYGFLRSKAEKRGTTAEYMSVITLIYLGKYEEVRTNIKYLKEKDRNARIAEGMLDNSHRNERSYYDKIIDYLNKTQLVRSSSLN